MFDQDETHEMRMVGISQGEQDLVCWSRSVDRVIRARGRVTCQDSRGGEMLSPKNALRAYPVLQSLQCNAVERCIASQQSFPKCGLKAPSKPPPRPLDPLLLLPRPLDNAPLPPGRHAFSSCGSITVYPADGPLCTIAKVECR
jgi:hypothetical protein